MYKLTSFLAGIFLVTSVGLATPIYYTFEGTVNELVYIGNDGISTGITPDGIQVRSSVTYTYVIDEDLPGFVMSTDGTITYRESHTETSIATYDRFYSDFTGNYLMSDVTSTDENVGSHFAQFVDYVSNEEQDIFFLTGQDGFNAVQVEGFSASKDLQTGQAFKGQETATTINGATFFLARSNLILTGISSSNPSQSDVPEPAVTTMLWGSIAALSGFNLIRKHLRLSQLIR